MRKIAALLAVTFVAPMMTAGAQQVVPAAVVRPAAVYVRPSQAPTDSIRPLLFHIKRAAAYGTVTGVVLSGLAILAIKESEGGATDGGSTRLTTRQGLSILSFGTASGLALGAFL